MSHPNAVDDGRRQSSTWTRRVFDDELRSRFVEYRQTSDRELRNRLVEEHEWLADMVVRRFRDRGEPAEDLRQVALLGLVKAVERFDPAFGTTFSTFAVPTLLGELRRHFRDTTWSVHVTRAAKELHLKVGPVVNLLSQQLGRSPLPAEVAAALDITVDEVLEAAEAGNAYRSACLDDLAPNEASDGGTSLGTRDRDLDLTDVRVTLAQLLSQMPPRDRRVLEMRYVEQRTQREIAAEVGLSQVHVSRLLRASLDRLHDQLELADRAAEAS
jgi:RNA polymerase sigma-B factor